MIVGHDGLRPDPCKLATIRELASPQTARQLKSALGLMNFYRRFVCHFSSKTKQFHQLLGSRHGSEPLEWTDELEAGCCVLLPPGSSTYSTLTKFKVKT